MLRLTAPQLAALPWEAMYDPQVDAFVCRTQPLVRHVPAPFTPEPLDVTLPLRILAVVSAPQGTQPLDSAAERQRLTDALAGPVAKGLVELHWLTDGTWEAVQDSIASGQWHVLHFIGHGAYDVAADHGLIALENADRTTNPVDPERLADLLGATRGKTRLVVLNSCSSGAEGSRDLFSGVAAALVHRGISAVAAMQFTVRDTTALDFALGFYTALAHGSTVEDAVTAGRVAILNKPNTLEWVTPVLYVRGDATQLFNLAPVATPRWSRRRLLLVGAAAAVIAALVAVLAVTWPRSAGNTTVPAPGTAPKLLAVGRIPTNLGNACENQKGWAFPQSVDSLPMATHVSDPTFVAKYGGIPVSGNYYAFSLSALTPDAVLVESVDARVLSRGEPLHGVYPPPWTGGCGGVIPSLFRMNLDNSPVSVVALPGSGVTGSTEPVPLPHNIVQNAPEVWYISAVTDACTCEWEAVVHWRSGERTGEAVLDDDGKPFRVTALTNTTAIDNANGTLDKWRITPRS